MAKAEPVRSIFAERVSQRRKELGYTLDGLGRKVGVGEGGVWKWENEDREPDYSTLLRLAAVLGVKVDWLLGAPDAVAPLLPRLKYGRAKRLSDAVAEIAEVLAELSPEDDEDADATSVPQPPPARPAPPLVPRPRASKRPRRGGTA